METPTWLKNICRELITQGLKDLENKKKFPDEFLMSKKWFEAKDRKAFGYYFCLEHSCFNPNPIRKFLDKHGIINK